jgi:hypothetical protein
VKPTKQTDAHFINYSRYWHVKNRDGMSSCHLANSLCSRPWHPAIYCPSPRTAKSLSTDSADSWGKLSPTFNHITSLRVGHQQGAGQEPRGHKGNSANIPRLVHLHTATSPTGDVAVHPKWSTKTSGLLSGFFVCFWWYWGLNSGINCVLSRCTSSPFCSGYFGDRVLFYAQPDLDHDLPVSRFEA